MSLVGILSLRAASHEAFLQSSEVNNRFWTSCHSPGHYSYIHIWLINISHSPGAGKSQIMAPADSESVRALHLPAVVFSLQPHMPEGTGISLESLL